MLALNRAGYPAQIDGIFGQNTCKALQEFKREHVVHGEVVGCYVDQVVWQELIPYLKGYVTHTIANGDTIEQLARRYGATQEAILRANPPVGPRRWLRFLKSPVWCPSTIPTAPLCVTLPLPRRTAR